MRNPQEVELREQIAALQEADRRKHEFLATLVHDLRSPLSAISNAVQVWKLVEGDKAQLQQLQQIIERQLELISGLLDVSRIIRDQTEQQKDGGRQERETLVPLPRTTDPADQDGAAQAEAVNATDQSPPSLKVLVVDDVRASAKTLALMLQAIGQQADVLHDGAAAVEWVVKHRPQMVFLDITMPGMNGYDVARAIRGCEELRDVYLVALTGHGEEEDRQRSLAAGFDEHLTKPTSVDALRRLLAGVARAQLPLSSDGNPARS